MFIECNFINFSSLGLYIGSNGYLVTEVIQIRRQFGHWPGDDGIDDLSKLEPCNYVEVVKLTGDHDVPAGQVSISFLSMSVLYQVYYASRSFTYFFRCLFSCTLSLPFICVIKYHVCVL